MTEREVINLRTKLNKVLEEFNKTSDIKMKLGNGTYGDTVTFKLEGSPVKNGKVRNKEYFDFKKNIHRHGISENALNYKFSHLGKTIEVTGYNKRAKRYPITYKLDDKDFKCSTQYIKNIFKTSAPELLFF